MPILEGFQLAFASGGVEDERFVVLGVTGEEEISKLFEFKIYFTRDEEALTQAEIDALLEAPCAVAMGPNPGDVVHGLLRRIEMLDQSGTIVPRYVATLVPNAWLMTLARTNRIYQNVTVPEMIAKLFTTYGLEAGADFELRVDGSYETREYVVQYEESDWDFVQRWLETEGLFYYFDHTRERDVLVLSDNNAASPPITAPSKISYRRKNDLATEGISTVWGWQLDQQRLPARVALYDYNYRTPNVRLIGKADVDPTRGFGSVMVYNEHFKTNEEGAALAAGRAERLLCTKQVFMGWTDCPRFRVGHVFTLQDHYESSNDGVYLVTQVEHDVGHGVPDPRDEFAINEQSREAVDVIGNYRARFEAIPLAIQFRPARGTPWPRVTGLMHGHVEEDSGGQYAQIDDVGRYKIRLPFDSGNAPGTTASRWMRMVQPYSGAGYGQHHPLHKGTEVIVAYLDGDPDRPIIVGSVPHTLTVSPVSLANHTQSVTHTASGIRVELEDLQE